MFIANLHLMWLHVPIRPQIWYQNRFKIAFNFTTHIQLVNCSFLINGYDLVFIMRKLSLHSFSLGLCYLDYFNRGIRTCLYLLVKQNNAKSNNPLGEKYFGLIKK